MRVHNLFFRSAVIGFLVGTLMVSSAHAEANKSTGDSRMAIRKVVLYKCGVGYFEMRGSAKAGEAIRLYIDHDRMSDLLKSLTVINLSGGQVGSIVYESTKTAEQLLREYAFDLGKGRQGLPQVLEQLQGSEIEMVAGSAKVVGKVVGIERRTLIDGETKIPEFYLNTVDNQGRFRSLNTDEISGVRFLDRRLNQDIQRYLNVLFQKHRRNEKAVIIIPEGKGLQKLLISYVTEAPVWKATYRVVLPERDGGVKPFLQGWAIVDNVSEEDWKDVRLSLVSGLPVSFVMNMYDPQFRRRPVIEVQEKVPVAPTVPEAYAERVKGARKSRPPKVMAMPGRAEALELRRESEAKGGGEVDLEDRMRNLQTKAVTRQIGELFEYRIDQPVTIERNRAALVPIVAKEVEGQAVDLYNKKACARNPMAAVRLRNTTKLTLEGGPVTVIEGGNYAGEALIGMIKPDEERYIPYAVDLGLHVNTEHGSRSEPVDRVIIRHGTMRMHRGILETKTYNLDNKNDRARTVIIEHPYHPEWKLLNKERPLEITENYMRFEAKVPPKELARFSVKEIRDTWESMIVTNLTPDDIVIYARKGFFSEATRKQLERIVLLKAEIAGTNRDLQALQKEEAQIFKDQKRVRENISGLGQTVEEKELRSRYIRRLDLQETRLEKIRERQADLGKQRKTKQKQLDEMIGSLEQDLEVS